MRPVWQTTTSSIRRSSNRQIREATRPAHSSESAGFFAVSKCRRAGRNGSAASSFLSVMHMLAWCRGAKIRSAMSSQNIVPCLWFDDQAEQAAHFYTSTFPSGSIIAVSHFPAAGDNPSGKPPGSILTVEFEVAGQRFTALNGGPEFVINSSISIMASHSTRGSRCRLRPSLATAEAQRRLRRWGPASRQMRCTRGSDRGRAAPRRTLRQIGVDQPVLLHGTARRRSVRCWQIPWPASST
jgi:predicted 3-demethylubiquinone-9 3-methyltransferase (glyoxalase superfamily)